MPRKKKRKLKMTKAAKAARKYYRKNKAKIARKRKSKKGKRKAKKGGKKKGRRRPRGHRGIIGGWYKDDVWAEHIKPKKRKGKRKLPAALVKFNRENQIGRASCRERV